MEKKIQIAIGAGCAGAIVFFLIIGYICAKRRRSNSFERLPLTKHDSINITNKRGSINNHEKYKNLDSPKTERERGSTLKKSNSLNIKDVVMCGLMYVRSTDFSNPQFLEKIGTRSNKHFFFVDSSKDKGKFLMSMSIAGPKCELFGSDSSRATITKIITSAKCPFIVPTLSAEYHRDRNTFVVVRPFYAKGSIRDLIHNSSPQDKAEKKYELNRSKPLNEDKIAKYGRQILEGLQYLKLHNFPFYNVHAGNVVLDNNVARITDYETDLINLEPKFKQSIKGNINNLAPEVVGFACVLYEMAVGYELDSVSLDDYPSDCSTKAKKVLKDILHAADPSSITLKTILSMPFFSEVVLYSDWDGQSMQIEGKGKTLLESASSLANETAKIQQQQNEKKKETKSDTSSKDKSPKTTTKATTKKKKRASTLIKSSSTASLPSTGVPAPPPPPVVSSATGGRKDLLNSIEGFSSKKLKKTKTNDRSKPLI